MPILPRNNLTGQKLGRWTVISYSHRTPSKVPMWNCVCECGTVRVVSGLNLTHRDNSRRSQSCGCLNKEIMVKRNTTHGMGYSRVESIWSGMKARCNPNGTAAHIKHHAAIGVTYCERWKSFENFYADMGDPPTDKHTLDRYPDNSGNYEPSNCRWALQKEQCRNKRNNIMIEYNGEIKCLAEWCEIKKLRYFTVRDRLRSGWPVDEALNTPTKSNVFRSDRPDFR